MDDEKTADADRPADTDREAGAPEETSPEEAAPEKSTLPDPDPLHTGLEAVEDGPDEAGIGEEEDEDEDDGDWPGETVVDMNDPVARLAGEVSTLKDQLLRALAETENVRRRLHKERDDARRYAVADFAREVLTIGDNLRRALEALPAENGGDNGPLGALAAGVRLTGEEFDAILARHGVVRIDPLGEKFDHNLHQAMLEVETADHQPGMVAQVLQVGYVIHDRLLRPAMVGVAKGTTAPPGDRIDTSA